MALPDAVSWQVVDHYENPRNVGSLDRNAKNVGTGLVGAPACGDVMKLQVTLGTCWHLGGATWGCCEGQTCPCPLRGQHGLPSRPPCPCPVPGAGPVPLPGGPGGGTWLS